MPYSLAMIAVALMQAADITEMVAAFAPLGWNGKGHLQFEQYMREHREGTRTVLIARWGGAFAGYVTILWSSAYPPFREADIPEVSDLNVLPQLRHRHVGSRLMDEAERLVAARSPMAGIGVGLHGDYGAAQQLYMRRGYVPDARGITSHGKHVGHGDSVLVDDHLILWLTKLLL